jgi:hypothetical protein
MSQPVIFEISTHNGQWCLHKDGVALHDYSHADRAVHEAVGLARELEHSGQPVQILLKAKDGKTIEITTDTPPPAEEDGSPSEETSALDRHH